MKNVKAFKVYDKHNPSEICLLVWARTDGKAKSLFLDGWDDSEYLEYTDLRVFRCPDWDGAKSCDAIAVDNASIPDGYKDFYWDGEWDW